jgi:hypothetical protein
MDNPEKWATLGNNTERWRKKKTKPPKRKEKKNQTNNKDKLADEQHITPQIHKVNPRTRERYAAPVSYKTTTVIPIVR